MEKLTMTVAEAIELTGGNVSKPTFYNWTEREDFPALIRVGRKKLILVEPFKEWLAAQTGKTI